MRRKTKVFLKQGKSKESLPGHDCGGASTILARECPWARVVLESVENRDGPFLGKKLSDTDMQTMIWSMKLRKESNLALSRVPKRLPQKLSRFEQLLNTSSSGISRGISRASFELDVKLRRQQKRPETSLVRYFQSSQYLLQKDHSRDHHHPSKYPKRLSRSLCLWHFVLPHGLHYGVGFSSVETAYITQPAGASEIPWVGYRRV